MAPSRSYTLVVASFYTSIDQITQDIGIMTISTKGKNFFQFFWINMMFLTKIYTKIINFIHL
ncbi:hypothetical protein LBH_1169 [Lactobacillus helveticus H9]|nr:hypothetical protein LBH_1169 [Lactobacillus helveticus H9]